MSFLTDQELAFAKMIQSIRDRYTISCDVTTEEDFNKEVITEIEETFVKLQKKKEKERENESKRRTFCNEKFEDTWKTFITKDPVVSEAIKSLRNLKHVLFKYKKFKDYTTSISQCRKDFKDTIKLDGNCHNINTEDDDEILVDRLKKIVAFIRLLKQELKDSSLVFFQDGLLYSLGENFGVNKDCKKVAFTALTDIALGPGANCQFNLKNYPDFSSKKLPTYVKDTFASPVIISNSYLKRILQTSILIHNEEANAENCLFDSLELDCDLCYFYNGKLRELTFYELDGDDEYEDTEDTPLVTRNIGIEELTYKKVSEVYPDLFQYLDDIETYITSHTGPMLVYLDLIKMLEEARKEAFSNFIKEYNKKDSNKKVKSIEELEKQNIPIELSESSLDTIAYLSSNIYPFKYLEQAHNKAKILVKDLE